MSLGAITGVVGLLMAVILALRARARLRGLRLGDLVKVPVPRQLAGPLAIGTRLDIGAALKESGMNRDEIRALLDGDHDQELIDRYWSLPGATGATPPPKA
jgi:hypothetical protein